jgi:ABC-2 type transport system permease protein
MKISRIYAIVLRNLYSFRRNYDRWFDAFYWAIMDLLLWGLATTYISELSPEFAKVTVIIVSGITFWFIVTRSQYETNVALLEDIWSRNLLNIFISPLKFSEWIVGVLIIGIIKALITFITAMGVAYLLYKVNILSTGLWIPLLIVLLLMTGWWTSFFITSAILRFGSKIQTFAWTLVVLLAPFSGIYYPISALPHWAQTISYFLPTTYVFTSLRQLITTGNLDVMNLFISFFLNIIYLSLGIFLLYSGYKKLLNKGMLQLY